MAELRPAPIVFQVLGADQFLVLERGDARALGMLYLQLFQVLQPTVEGSDAAQIRAVRPGRVRPGREEPSSACRGGRCLWVACCVGVPVDAGKAVWRLSADFLPSFSPPGAFSRPGLPGMSEGLDRIELVIE